MVVRIVALVAVASLMHATAVVAKPAPPLGVRAPAPLSPTEERVRARSCAATPPVELGPTRDGSGGVPRVAFGASSGLAGWSPRVKRLALRPIDHAGNPTGPVVELDVPADLDLVEGLRALDRFYLVLLRASVATRMFALVVTPTGAHLGEPLQLDIGEHRGDVVSDAAAHGVVVYAGGNHPNERTARIITIYVSADGSISQSIRDVADPEPGTRAFPQFSFSAQHAVGVLPEHIIVDGQLRPSPEDPAITGGRLIAPTFVGDKIQIVGFTVRGDDGKRRYGTLSLTGKRRYERMEEPRTDPPRPPFDDEVRWVVSPQDGGGVTIVAGLRGKVMGPEIKVPWPNITSGNETRIEWTGSQALALYAAGKKAQLAPLPCK